MMTFETCMRSCDSAGYSAVFTPITRYLNTSLTQCYGDAIERIVLTPCFSRTIGRLTREEKKVFGQLPRVRFQRNNRKVELHFLTLTLNAHDGDSTRLRTDTINAAMSEVAAALDMIQQRVRETDNFDTDRFLKDSRELLANRFESADLILEIEEAARACDESQNRDADADLSAHWISNIWIEADQRIAGRFQDGFVVRFGLQSSCITDWYDALLHRNCRGSTPRLTFEFSDQVDAPAVLASARTAVPFDFDAYESASGHERKRRLADAVRDGLLWLGENRGWDLDPIRDAHQTIVAADCTYVGKGRSGCVSPCEGFTARIEFDYDLAGIDLEAVLTRRGGRTPICRRRLGRADPGKWHLKKLLGAAGWLSSTEFGTVGPWWKHACTFADVMESPEN